MYFSDFRCHKYWYLWWIMDKVNWKPSGKDHHSRCYLRNLWFVGSGQNSNINRTLEEIDSNPHRWLWGVADFSGGSKEVTTDVVEIPKEQELEVEHEDVPELL